CRSAGFCSAERASVAVGAVGVDEFRRDQDRLVVAAARLRGGARVAPVLALVEGADALETVIGPERAAAEHLRLRRLDADSEVDDGVDVGMRGGELEHLRNRVAG